MCFFVSLFFKFCNYFSGKCPIPQGTKPVLSFAGDQWEAESETVDYPLVRNLLLDFYRGETAKSIRLKGLELFIQFTLVNDVIAMRTYQVKLVKSGMDQPRVELESIGPGEKHYFKRFVYQEFQSSTVILQATVINQP